MSLLPIDEALERLLSDLTVMTSEGIPLKHAIGRVLAEPVYAALDHPRADNSAMDGFALRAEDGLQTRRLLGQSAAGHPDAHTVHSGDAVRIFTGGLLPPGANAVLIQENAHWDEDHCQPHVTPRLGAHIRRRAEDFSTGDELFASGVSLRAIDLALLASQGMTEVQVHRRPTFAVIATGDELVHPGKPLGPGQIYESNALMVSGQAEAAGAQLTETVLVPDDPHETSRNLRRLARDCDLLICCGGASVGEHDHVVSCLQEEAEEGLEFYRVQMKPGKPVAAARLGNCIVLCLPGNPASSAVAFEQFVRPCLRRLQGDRRPHRRLEQRFLAGPISGPQKRCRFLRARLEADGQVTPLPKQGSGMLSSLASVDGFVMIPAGTPPLSKGDPVAFQTLDGPGDNQPPEAQWRRMFS